MILVNKTKTRFLYLLERDFQETLLTLVLLTRLVFHPRLFTFDFSSFRKISLKLHFSNLIRL